MSGLTVAMAERIELWPVADLKKYARNSRTHSAEQIQKIANSIEEFGFTNPILVDEKSREIIAGHGRLDAALVLRMDEVPVIPLGHMTEAQRRAYVIADNKLAELAGWDTDLLAEEVAALEGAEFDLDLLGFSDQELEDLLAPKAPTTTPGQEGKGGGQPFTYQLIFQSEGQQNYWLNFLEWLEGNAKGETVGERLQDFIKGRKLIPGNGAGRKA